MAEPNSIGDSLSIISLKVKNSSGKANTPQADPCIGHVNIPLGTLLEICVGDEVAVLKVTPITVKPEQPRMGFLTIRLSKLEDPAELNLALNQLESFERLEDLLDLENAIANLLEAVELTDDIHPDKPSPLSNLGTSQQTRFEYLSEMSDLESAIMNLRAAVELTDDAHPDKPVHLSNLGISQRTRFENLGELSDLGSAIANLRDAVEITDSADPDKPAHLTNLGISERTRFEHLTPPGRARKISPTVTGCYSHVMLDANV